MIKTDYNCIVRNMNFIGSIVFFTIVLVISLINNANAAPPTVTIDIPANGTKVEFGSSVLFSATANDPEGGELTYLWHSSTQGELSTESTFTTSELAEGTHTITVVVTDEDGEKADAQINITVEPSEPTIIITNPENGDSYDYNSPLVTVSGDFVMFEATATDAQDDPEDIKITWRSSIDSDFGSGDSVGPVTLSAGKHLIEAIATDSDGNTATDSISITIDNQPPVATISLPKDKDTFAFGALITFTGSGTDPEQGKLTGDALAWTSSQGDFIGTGEVVSTKNLKSGTHIITLTATDSSGVTDTTSITITIGNSPPKAEITSPEDGASFKFGDTVTFKGTGTDDEDVTLPVDSLVWTSSSSDTALGQGTSLSVSDLPSGTHTITLTVTDSEDAVATDQIIIVIGNTSPVPVITSPANNSSHSVGREITFEGTASDAEDGPLSGESLTWSSDKDGILGSGYSIVTDKLSINTHVITLTATDKEGVKGSVTITITVGNASPVVLITSPANNSSHGAGKTITFSGTATDVEDGTLKDEKLLWTSDIDGFLGYGETLEQNALSVNTHVITLTATDSGGRTGSSSITITVENASPVALITSPADNSSHQLGKDITFTGTGTDAEDGDLTEQSLKWESSISGFLGYGETLTLDTLAVGTHTITLTVTDSNRLTGVDTISITVGNASPVALITSPADNSSHQFGKEITFTGTGTDAEDGDLTEQSLKWESSISGFLGYGKTLTLNNLAVGTHTITLTVTDSNRLTGVDTISITVGNASPVALITSPADNSSHQLGKDITFSGTGTDAEDGDLTEQSLKWESSISGFLGYGETLTLDTLAVGTHRITLTVIDSNRLTGVDTISITVGNASPLALITSPADNSSHQFGKDITFTGTGTDAEDGDLTDKSLKWESSISGFLGYGETLTLDNLAVGTHTITLTVTDSNRLTGVDTISITVGNASPVALITSPADNSSHQFGKDITFTGTGTDAEDGDLTEQSLKWESSISGFLGYGETLTLDTLAVGTHTITLTVTDSNRLTGVDTISITVGNASPVALITSPADNSSHQFGKDITFAGTGTDAEDGDLTEQSLKWESSISGFLGYGKTLTLNNLAVGTHTITLTVTDSNRLTGVDTISITVGNASPVALITSPADNSSHQFGKDITFTGTGTDAEDGDLTEQSLKWESSISGFLGYGETLTLDTLAVGTHTITLTVTDSNRLTGVDTISITVGNASPVALITSPADNSSHQFGKDITFAGTGTDAEDGDLTEQSLKWESSISGFLGYGETLTLDNLAVGTHTITLTATDKNGLTGIDTISLIIINTSPSSVKIITPSDGSKFALNEYISFKGEAFDSEDGELKGASLVWTSNRVDTSLGSGNQISINSLALGQHLITLTATDSSGSSKQVFITITIGTAALPTVSILTPQDGSTFYMNEYIEFTGEAFDNIDGELKGDNLVWKSNIQTSSLVNGNLGTGNIIRLNTLSIGEHLITLTANNSNNIAGIDFIVITIGNHAPVAVINSPDNKDIFNDGEIINFSGYATDEEDGEVTGSSLLWTSDIDGYLGSGMQFSQALSYGEHTITLKAKDRHGSIGTKNISLSIKPTEQNQPLALENMEVSIPLGQSGEFYVTGGHPPYRYYKEYPYIASIDIIGKKIRIVPKSIGETTFKITDHYNNSKILSLKVTDSLQNVPRADAGKEQNVIAGEGVILDGTSSFQGSNGIVSWLWTQIFDEAADENSEDISVVLSDSSSSKAMFVAPSLSQISQGSTNSDLKLTFRLTVTDKDGNESSDDVDINITGNGISGYPQGVTTFYTIDQNKHLGIRLIGDGDIVYINPESPEFIKETSNRPENMLYGLVDLKIKVQNGQDANVVIYFPNPLGEDYTAYKYGVTNSNSENIWYDYSDHITFSSDRTKAYLILKDGAQGDDDGVVNGIINDPIAFGTKSKTPSEPDLPSGEGGGGGGCFISTLFE